MKALWCPKMLVYHQVMSSAFRLQACLSSQHQLNTCFNAAGLSAASASFAMMARPYLIISHVYEAGLKREKGLQHESAPF